MQTLLIFGVGYTGKYAAYAFKRRGYQVYGTTRSEESAQELKELDLLDRVFCVNDELQPEPEELFESVTHILVTAGPTEHGDPFLHYYEKALLNSCQNLKWVGYLSTIGVYGDTQGEYVDESAELRSELARSKRRIIAEKQWLELEDIPVHIFRLPGIYGPGRGPLAKARTGKANRINLGGRVFNRIHVHDITNTLLKSARCVRKHEIYNVADNLPEVPEQVVLHACELQGISPPELKTWEEASATMSEMAKSFYAESKKISNSKLKNELGISLLYPTYREGFVATLKEEKETWLCQIDRRVACIVVNNGSVRAEPYLGLQTVCDQLTSRANLGSVARVVGASARYADRIAPELLNSERGKVFEEALRELLVEGYRKIVVLPLFFGPSRTITEYVPSIAAKVGEDLCCEFDINVADHLVTTNDNRIARALEENVQSKLNESKPELQHRVVVVDHGSPLKEVWECREIVGNQLLEILKDKVDAVSTASMERREGDEYAFNEPLLSTIFDSSSDFTSQCTIIALLFLSNGRHAGPNGDIEEILAQVREKYPSSQFLVTSSLQSSRYLSLILMDRLQAVLANY